MANPDPQMGWGGGVGGGTWSPNFFFFFFGPQFSLKIRGEEGPSRAPPLDPPMTSTRVPAVNGIVLTPTGCPICNGVHINAPVMQSSGLPRNY